MARMPKFAILPSVRPPAKQKEATTAAVSTSSLVIRRLCSRDGADIIQRLPHLISQKLMTKWWKRITCQAGHWSYRIRIRS
jgi:hypothetical protein